MTFTANFAKRGVQLSITYLAQLPQIAARPAPWATSNIPPISCSKRWEAKSPPSFPQPVRPLWERLPDHITSALAS